MTVIKLKILEIFELLPWHSLPTLIYPFSLV